MPGGLALNELAAHSSWLIGSVVRAPHPHTESVQHQSKTSRLARYNAPRGNTPYARLRDGLCCFFAASKQVNAQNNDNHRVK